MESVVRLIPIILSLISRGGDIARAIGLLMQALEIVQSILPAPASARPDVSSMRGIQEALKELGFDPGPIDGVLGEKTRSAVKLFQLRHPPLLADGWPGGKTQAALAVALGG